MKIAEALPREDWHRLLKREPIKRDAAPKAVLVETPAEVMARIGRR